MNEDVS